MKGTWKRTQIGMASSAASRGCSTNGSALDIRRSLDRDPQPVQQDEQDRDAGIYKVRVDESSLASARKLSCSWSRGFCHPTSTRVTKFQGAF